MLFKKLFYLTLPAAIFASSTCFWPNGEPAAGYNSCGDDTSQCCSEESICLTNGYCMSMVFSFTLSRPTCKDMTWKTCENPCEGITERDDGGCALPFYGTIDGEALYCPDSIVSNSTGLGCKNDAEPFSVGPASIITNKGALKGASCAVDPIDPKLGATQASSATKSPIETVTNGPTPSCSSDSDDDSSSKNAAIGAGVGVPLGIISLVTIAWALFERKKRYQMINSPPPRPMVVEQAMPQSTRHEMAATPKLGGDRGIQELEGERGYK